MVRLLCVVFLVAFSSVAFSEPLIEFTPTGTLPNSDYIYGTASYGNVHGAFALKKGDNVYVASLYDGKGALLDVKITSLGLYDNGVIVGGNNFQNLKQAWVMMISLKDEPKVINILSHCNVDSYSYDFYFDVSDFHEPTYIKDVDNDGLPEFEVDFYLRRFRMIFELSDKGVAVDYSSPYYLRAFNELNKTPHKDEYQLREFLLYGVISGKLSANDGVRMLLNQNSQNRNIIPQIMSKAGELKKLSESLGAQSLTVAYFNGDIKADDIVKELEAKGKDSSELMFGIFEFEEDLRSFHLDEVAFNDFVLYFSNSMSEDELKKSASNSLSSHDGDIYSILTNYSSLNDIMKDKLNVKIEKFYLKQ